MMLSEPPRDVANGCVTGYLRGFVNIERCLNTKQHALLQSRFDAFLRHVNDADEPEHHAFLCSVGTELIKVGVEGRKLRKELVARGDVFELGGH